MKPQLAEDAILDKLIFPAWQQPKIDGVRAMNLQGQLTGRSLDPFPGFGITDYFSKPEFRGLDGEMILGADPTAPRLCSLTTGAMGRFKGVTEMADLTWWIFDLVLPEIHALPYEDRYALAYQKVKALGHPRLKLVPFQPVHNLREVQAGIATHLDAGYEGTILRNPRAPHKQGRATQKMQELWRVKPWVDSEMLVTTITEGQENRNEAKKNTLGRTERSSAKEGMVPNGQIGSLTGPLLEDVFDVGGKLLFKKGHVVTIGSGEMTVDQATRWFKDPSQIIDHAVKFKHLAYGVKDTVRMGTFISKRLPQDRS